ncbi:MAG: ribosomal-processing cysteine protease Prp [Clostridiales bacterium]|nr:ribosomal-processing cysteine protease Prp [Clostridiales bacterium]
MITVTFFKENGSIVKVRARGHSGLSEYGSDVLCAAASALIQTAYLAVADILGNVKYKRNDDKGEFEFEIPKDCIDRHDVDVVLRALTIGLSDLQSGYPQNIKLEEQ